MNRDVRRTKEDAEETRNAILDAAEIIFAEKGISGPSLESISRAAGATRGALYWHFKNKTDLLNALRTRRKLPQEELLILAGAQGHEDPLSFLEATAHEILAIFEADESQQRMFRISLHAAADETVADWTTKMNNEVFENLQRVTALAEKDGSLNPNFTPREAAIMMMVTMNGIVSEWQRSSHAFQLTTLGWKLISAQMSLIRKSPEQK